MISNKAIFPVISVIKSIWNHDKLVVDSYKLRKVVYFLNIPTFFPSLKVA